MNPKDGIDEINKRYSKWLISFRLANTSLYTVWGSDSNDGGEDKLWIDANQKIILFEDPKKVTEVIISVSMPTFDTENLVNWALRRNDYQFSDSSEFKCDLDDLLLQAGVISYEAV